MAKAKANRFNTGYKQYDTTNGFGSEDEWRQAFEQRFTESEAKEILEEEDLDAWGILGLQEGASLQIVKRRFRELIVIWHPDKAALHGKTIEESEAMSKKIIAAYSLILAWDNTSKPR